LSPTKMYLTSDSLGRSSRRLNTAGSFSSTITRKPAIRLEGSSSRAKKAATPQGQRKVNKLREQASHRNQHESHSSSGNSADQYMSSKSIGNLYRQLFEPSLEASTSHHLEKSSSRKSVRGLGHQKSEPRLTTLETQQEQLRSKQEWNKFFASEVFTDATTEAAVITREDDEYGGTDEAVAAIVINGTNNGVASHHHQNVKTNDLYTKIQHNLAVESTSSTTNGDNQSRGQTSTRPSTSSTDKRSTIPSFKVNSLMKLKSTKHQDGSSHETSAGGSCVAAGAVQCGGTGSTLMKKVKSDRLLLNSRNGASAVSGLHATTGGNFSGALTATAHGSTTIHISNQKSPGLKRLDQALSPSQRANMLNKTDSRWQASATPRRKNPKAISTILNLSGMTSPTGMKTSKSTERLKKSIGHGSTAGSIGGVNGLSKSREGPKRTNSGKFGNSLPGKSRTKSGRIASGTSDSGVLSKSHSVKLHGGSLINGAKTKR